MSIRTKVWTLEEYERLVAAGAFHPEARLQLIQGEIVEMVPQSATHATSLLRAQNAMSNAFRGGYHIRAQLPLALGPQSEPEPDLAIIPGSLDDYRTHHPTTATVVVEIADTTLGFDRSRKLEMYAQAQIPEYWIVNLVDGVLEVYRQPQGSGYRTSLRLDRGSALSPLAAPSAQIKVADLLP